MTDADQGGEWVTGIIGEPFQLDKDGKPIPNAPAEAPTESPSATDIWDTLDKPAPGGDPGSGLGLGGGLGDLMPTGILPEREPQMIGGGDDETQKEIWEQMERGDFGSPAGSIPDDAETTI